MAVTEIADVRERAITLTLARIQERRRRPLSREQVDAAADAIARAGQLRASGRIDEALAAAREAEAAVEGVVIE